MSLESMFPETVFAKQYIKKYGLNKAISKQCEVVTGELFELRDAASREDYYHTVEEAIDAIQAIYTLVYMILGYSPEQVQQIIDEVQQKNNKRGYYV
ncbi:hypothetical protein LCGC14_2905140, partial [marine sediment metagenome]